MSLRIVRSVSLSILLFITSMSAHATLSSDLSALNTNITSLNSSLSGFSFLAGGDCASLGTLNTSIADYTKNVEAATTLLTSTLTLTSSDLTSLDSLSNTSYAMANQAMRLSLELRSVEGVYDVFEYRAALSAVLELSYDIGTMSDRILEMANRILLMAGNIGTMADRILITQQLQNQNVALVETAILGTQQNMVAMSDSVSTIVYNLTLAQLNSEGQNLLSSMSSTTLTSSNMASALASLESATSALMVKSVNLYTLTAMNSQGASHYINGDTLTSLGNLTILHRSLALAIENYAKAVQALAPVTNSVVLKDATTTTLKLANEVALMSNRIVEMSDKIIVMADNIGLMADRIVETQTLQQTNITLTESSILTAQNVTLTVIKNMGL